LFHFDSNLQLLELPRQLMATLVKFLFLFLCQRDGHTAFPLREIFFCSKFLFLLRDDLQILHQLRDMRLCCCHSSADIETVWVMILSACGAVLRGPRGGSFDCLLKQLTQSGHFLLRLLQLHHSVREGGEGGAPTALLVCFNSKTFSPKISSSLFRSSRHSAKRTPGGSHSSSKGGVSGVGRMT
jgi:hypothetical protein